MALRSSQAQLEQVQSTIKEGDREISLIRARLEANDTIYANLRATLVDCIKKANQELDGGQPPQPLSVSASVLASVLAPVSAPEAKGQAQYFERLTAHYNDKFAD